MNRLTFLWQGAKYQDDLLQAYRNFHFTMQSFLLAIGTGLSTTVILVGNTIEGKAIYIVLIIISALGLFLLRVMRKLILARREDVNYFHDQVIEAEKELPQESQVLTAFKVYQKFTKEKMNVAATPLPDVNEAMRAQLIEKEKGHTRQLLDTYLTTIFLVVWLSFHVVIAITAAWKSF